MSATPSHALLEPRGGSGEHAEESVFFDSGDRQLFGRLHHPSGEQLANIGLVICKPFGYEALCGHRSIRAFADMAAELGMPVLRFDYLGTGDSQDIDPSADQIDAWVADVQAAVAHLRALTGVTRVCLMGIRLGALLAALAVARTPEVSNLILMAPVVSGRRHLRELRSMRLIATSETETAAAPAASPEAGASDEFNGYEMSAATLAALAAQDLTKTAMPRVTRVLIMDRSDFPAAKALRDTLTAAGKDVEYSALPGYFEMALVAPHYAVTPAQMLDAARDWLIRTPDLPTDEWRRAGTTSLTLKRLTQPVSYTSNGVAPQERAVTLGDRVPLFGIVTEPRPGELRRRAVILLNVGVDYHIGPSRMYVSLARRWAQRGYYVLRVDLAGIGDSQTLPGREENVVYAPDAVEHVCAAAEFMRSRYGIQDLTLAGICSGAYHGLRAAASGLKVERLLLVNPQTFFWKEGMSLDALTSAEVVRNPKVYRRRLLSFTAWRRVLKGEVNLWRILMVFARRTLMSLESKARDWTRAVGFRLADDLGHDLEAIVGRGVRMVFAFAPGEPGLALLRLQGGSSVRKLGEKCRIRTLAHGDHTFSERGPRRVLEECLSDELFSRPPHLSVVGGSVSEAPKRPRPNRWRVLAAIAVLAVATALWVASRAFYYGSLDYGGNGPPSPLLEHPDRAGLVGLTEVGFTTGDGTAISGWYVPSRDGGAAIIVTSGTSANRTSMLAEIRTLATAGFGVLAFDWPGTGRSGGQVNWGAPAVATLESAIDWLAARPEVDPGRIGALGFSAGGMVTVQVAAKDKRLRAVVLSGTSSEIDATRSWFHLTPKPLRELPTEWAARAHGWPLGVVRPAMLVAAIAPRPVFLIGGSEEPDASPKEVARMCDAAHDPKECWVVPGASHGAYAEAAPQAYASRLTDFFTRGLLGPAI